MSGKGNSIMRTVWTSLAVVSLSFGLLSGCEPALKQNHPLAVARKAIDDVTYWNGVINTDAHRAAVKINRLKIQFFDHGLHIPVGPQRTVSRPLESDIASVFYDCSRNLREVSNQGPEKLKVSAKFLPPLFRPSVYPLPRTACRAWQ